MRTPLTIMLLCLFVGTNKAQLPNNSVYAVADISTELRERAESVIRFEELKFELLDEHKATIRFEQVVTILDKDSDAHRVGVFHGPDIRVNHFSASIYDANGVKIRTARNSEIEDILAVGGGNFYVDDRYKSVDMEHGQLPYTVHFKYVLAVKDVGLFTNMPRWMPMGYDQSCENANLLITYPGDNPIVFESNEIGNPAQSADGTQETLHWELTNQPARISEWRMPARAQNLPYVFAGFDRFEVDNYTGSHRNWNSFGQFLYELNEGRQDLPEALRQEVQALVAELETDEEKIATLYRFLQDRTRYVSVQLGIGGWQPFSAAYVEENRYGDCKALSNYMRAILEEIGISSYPVIIYWGRTPRYEVHEDFATNTFNHQILYLPEEDMYLECTSNSDPPGYLDDGKSNRNVLLLTPEGGRLIRTPTPLPSDNAAIQSIDIIVGEDGNAEFNLHGEYHGARQDLLRGINDAYTQEDQLEYLHSRDILPAVSEVDYSLEVNRDHPIVEMDYSCSLDRYARKMGQRMFLPINRYFAYDNIPPADSEREFPIKLRSARLMVDTVRLQFPDNMEIESLGPELIELEHEIGSYRAEIKVTGNQLSWVRTLSLKPIELPAEGYEELRNFFVEVGKADGRQVVLKERRTR